MPDLVYTLNSYYEYRELTVYNPRVLIAPPENRLGRSIQDVLPSDLVESILRGTFFAVRDKTPIDVPYLTPRGTINLGTIHAPTPDVILISVREVA